MKLASRSSTLLRTLLTSMLCGGMHLALAQPVGTPPPLVVERLGVSETLLGILSYARWPNESAPLRLCVAGRGVHTEHLLRNGLLHLARRPIVVQALALETDAPIATQCDAIYIGPVEDTVSRRIFSHAVGHAVLTISERTPSCATGVMVCLDINDLSRVQFEVNLDAVARSGVRVNPQVLRLGRRTAKASP